MIDREKTAKQVRFGFLNCKWTIEFKGGTVSPIPEFDEVAAWVHKYTNEDGFLYPPLTQRVRWNPKTKKSYKKIPRTKRPALLRRLPASHELCLSTSSTIEDIRKGSGAFVIHLLAYLFGTRLQFHDWWFDGRVPIRLTDNFTKATAENFLSHCYQTWLGWTKKQQRLITNLLYMYSRASLYEWGWERFTIEYMVLDGCWNLAKLRLGGKVRHEDRICILCKEFQIPFEDQLVKNIVKLRNNLFHETLWDGSQPCTTVSSSAFQQPSNLHRLNQRLIPALLGYKTPYVKTAWWTLGAWWFDQP